MRSFISTLAFLIFSTQGICVAKELKSSEILTEAQSSFMRGDLFSANRFYTLALEKVPQSLDPSDVENIVVSKYINLPLKQFLSYCKEESKKSKLKVETNFYCAKTLIHNENYVEAVDYIEAVPKNYHRLEYHFLRASLNLKLNKTENCLIEMKLAEEKVTENTSLHFKDLVQVIFARCLLAEGRYEEAVNKFQRLSVNSSFYLTTLEEQAWAHFKARNLTSSRDILKILISYFTGQDVKNQIFGADVYFRVKYLQAYIELISQNREISRELFASLKTEIQKFKKDSLKKIAIPKDAMIKLSKLKTTSQLLSKDYAFIAKYRNFMQTWSAVNEMKALDKDIRYLIAINSEMESLQKIRGGEFSSYISRLKSIQRLQSKIVYEEMNQSMKQARRNIDSIEFKANMGQVENFWAARTEGKRTLAEVLDAYKKEVTHVEDYLGK